MAHRSTSSHISKGDAKPPRSTKSNKSSRKRDIEQQDIENWNPGSHACSPDSRRRSGHFRHSSGSSKDGKLAGVGSWDNSSHRLPPQHHPSDRVDILSFAHRIPSTYNSSAPSRYSTREHDYVPRAPVPTYEKQENNQSYSENRYIVHRYLYDDVSLPSNARVTRDATIGYDHYPGHYTAKQPRDGPEYFNEYDEGDEEDDDDRN